MSPQTAPAVLVWSSRPSRRSRLSSAAASVTDQVRMNQKPRSMLMWLWYPNTGMATPTAGAAPPEAHLALVTFTVQRASRSLWHSLAGLAYQAAGIHL